MNRVYRVAAVIVLVPMTFYFIYWVPVRLAFHFVPLIDKNWIRSLVSLLCAVGAGWSVWNNFGSAPSGLVTSVLSGGLVLGVLSFCAGFFGPMVLTSGAHQGPLLGVLITGPWGFLSGLVGGLVYWLIKRKKAQAEVVASSRRS